jgi:hypothetical protein
MKKLRKRMLAATRSGNFLVFATTNIKLEVYRSIILPAVLAMCVSPGEQNRLRVSDNSVWRKIFGLRRRK